MPDDNKPKWTDIAIVILTVGIVSTAILQWREMVGSGQQTDRIIAAANLIEGHLNQTVADNQSALAQNRVLVGAALDENRKEFGKALDQNRQSLTANNAQANKSLNAAIDASRLDQRAWVNPGQCTLLGEPTAAEDIHIHCPLMNIGRTPALHVNNRIEKGINSDSLGPRAKPNWKTINPTANATLFPVDATGLSHPSVDPELNRATYSEPDWVRGIQEYSDGRATLSVWIYIEYDDVFNRHHFIQTCLYNNRKLGLAFAFCEVGNEIDHD